MNTKTFERDDASCRIDANCGAPCQCHTHPELNPMEAYLPIGGLASRLIYEGCRACGCVWKEKP